ncbi:hypothetical protein PENARI_c029G08463 [Penicillium arizonense]|uniref:Uncharacterized protein n=1 Tax=Penicillium arizonense TaxID=1835702 RepID=A0A1F5L549_PENAI|nr:hypothetical protein PENARI_c029G08463 [Penicillium arizonense]OGE48358.1 hypothetical protein PENARI_c029G08463 [Penicillium arizonense]
MPSASLSLRVYSELVPEVEEDRRAAAKVDVANLATLASSTLAEDVSSGSSDASSPKPITKEATPIPTKSLIRRLLGYLFFG